MRPKSRSNFCHVSVTPSQMTGCFEQKKGQIWPWCWTQSKLIEGRLLTTAQARSQISEKDPGIFSLEQDVLASRDGAQKSMEERSRPGFVSHALLTFGLTDLLLWGFSLQCQAFISVFGLYLQAANSMLCPFMSFLHSVWRCHPNVTGGWEPSFLYKRKYNGQKYWSKMNFVHLRNLKMGEV